MLILKDFNFTLIYSMYTENIFKFSILPMLGSVTGSFHLCITHVCTFTLTWTHTQRFRISHSFCSCINNVAFFQQGHKFDSETKEIDGRCLTKSPGVLIFRWYVSLPCYAYRYSYWLGILQFNSCWHSLSGVSEDLTTNSFPRHCHWQEENCHW